MGYGSQFDKHVVMEIIFDF